AVERRLVDRMVEAVLDRAAQQRLGQRPAVPERHRRLELGLEGDRLVDLEDLGQLAGLTGAGAEIPGPAHTGERVVPAVEPGPHSADLFAVLSRRHPSA